MTLYIQFSAFFSASTKISEHSSLKPACVFFFYIKSQKTNLPVSIWCSGVGDGTMKDLDREVVLFLFEDLILCLLSLWIMSLKKNVNTHIINKLFIKHLEQTVFAYTGKRKRRSGTVLTHKWHHAPLKRPRPIASYITLFLAQLSSVIFCIFASVVVCEMNTGW